MLALDGERVGQLVLGRGAAVDGHELLARLCDVALPAAQRARRPVLTAQLVKHGAVHPGPGVLLEGRAARGVEAVHRGDQGLDAAREQIVDLAPGRQLAQLAVHDVLDHAGVGHHQPVPQARVAGAAIFGVESERVGVGETPARPPDLAGGNGISPLSAARIPSVTPSAACIGLPVNGRSADARLAHSRPPRFVVVPVDKRNCGRSGALRCPACARLTRASRL